MELIKVLANGNMGAATVLTKLFTENAFSTFEILRKYNITGPLIWCLYKDVCKQNLQKMINVLENCENGNITPDILTHAVNNYGDGLDISRY